MPTQGQGLYSASSEKRSASTEEKAVLRFISEQEVIQVDHLARFFDLYLSDMTRILEEFVSYGWIVVEQLVGGESSWIGLRRRGALLAGTGFEVTQPAIASLAHFRAINEARFLTTKAFPEGKWTSERQLRRDWHRRRNTGYIPDAAFEVNGKRWAIEVELSRKPVEDLRSIIADHSIRYDVVVYLCSTAIARFMDRLNLVDEFSNLTVRELFEPATRLNKPAFRSPSRHRGREPRSKFREPEAWEVPILDLLAEQGAIPLDQLARFLKCDQVAAARIADHLENGRFIKRARPLANQLDWFWLTGRGMDCSSFDLSAHVPKLGVLERRRAINEIRLLLAERLPTARWESERVLRNRFGMKGSLPAAILHIGNGNTAERHSVEVCLTPGAASGLEKRMSRYGAKYHAAAFFCAPRVYDRAKRLVEDHDWPRVVVQRIPRFKEYPHYLSSRRAHVSLEPVDLRTMVGRLRTAVNSGELPPSRARSVAGYLLLSAAGVSQGAARTVAEFERDCRKHELLRDPGSPTSPPRRPRFSMKNVEKVIERAGSEVEAGRLLPSRARTYVGYAFLKAARISQGNTRTVSDLRKEVAALLGEEGRVSNEADEPLLPIEEPGLLTAQELRLANMAALGMTNCLIGQELDVSVASVSSTLAGVYAKLGITGSSYARRKKLPKALAYLDNGPVES